MRAAVVLPMPLEGSAGEVGDEPFAARGENLLAFRAEKLPPVFRVDFPFAFHAERFARGNFLETFPLTAAVPCSPGISKAARRTVFRVPVRDAFENSFDLYWTPKLKIFQYKTPAVSDP